MNKATKRVLSYLIIFGGLVIIKLAGPVGIIPIFIGLIVLYFVAGKIDEDVLVNKSGKRETTSDLVGEGIGVGLAKAIKSVKNNKMEIVDLKVNTMVEANIKVGNHKIIPIRVPTRKVMYMTVNPELWNEIDNTELDKKGMSKFEETLAEMEYKDNHALSELLLKVAGKHPESRENELTKKILSDKELAKTLSKYNEIINR